VALLAKQAVQTIPRAADRQGEPIGVHKHETARNLAKRASNIVWLAVAFEGGLGVIAVAIAQWFDLPLRSRLQVDGETVFRSAVAMLPMLVLLAVAMRSTWRPLAKLRQEVSRMVHELFTGVNVFGLAAVSLAAGFGEELLFRGVLQPLAERWSGAVIGLFVTSVVFGALHAMSRMYFVLATAVGFYLGWLAQHFGDLLTPIAVHALYDFAALVLLVRHWKIRSIDEGLQAMDGLVEEPL
jgi:membrane protease YdiL (CAAX protease family)